ncbi:hypothetical protein BDF20DRAFT_850834 [Mycotypha africana]|uniref:uncharacterized protein n=1 Tax=Mycotypha africana TaxID=64632 RepID=UPI002301DE5D|nr:uncharacterized protein BDF20DRAFT_850834 [Mycotypha africana]KAI8987545.1 hypothetical protein BDF20DRAFT_850834 [Mycotypha africana]
MPFLNNNRNDDKGEKLNEETPLLQTFTSSSSSSTNNSTEIDTCCGNPNGCCGYKNDLKIQQGLNDKHTTTLDIVRTHSGNDDENDITCKLASQPWKYKIVALSCAMFLAMGSHFAAHTLGAMKSTIKEVRILGGFFFNTPL